MDPFFEAKSNWRKLEDAQLLGLASQLTFDEYRSCFRCGMHLPQDAPLKCSKCKAVLYCGKECQDSDWRETNSGTKIPHRDRCASFKIHMELIPEVQMILTSFPWGRLERSGSFHANVVLAKFNILGGTGFGFWSQRGDGLHFEEDEEDTLMLESLKHTPLRLEAWRRAKAGQKSIDFLDGADLLKNQHLTELEGWKMPVELVSWDFSTASLKRPSISGVMPVINSWDSWHEWRAIPKTSVAALLMHYPLSMYWILVDTLRVITLSNVSARQRRTLCIHLIGAEIELNFLPIFAELALLLPRHNLHITLFGPCVYHLGQKARAPEHRYSLVHRTSNIAPNAPIFLYDAPEDLGAGKIRIYLHTDSKYWDEAHVYNHPPDAAIALNAGLFTYDASDPAVFFALRARIPCAVTDYQEYMLETNRYRIRELAELASGGSVTVRERPFEEWPISLNPFHRPGHQHRSSNVAPYLINGFTMPVYRHK